MLKIYFFSLFLYKKAFIFIINLHFTVYSGVPQSGVLVPFYLIYINDISSNTNIKCDLSFFADDTNFLVRLISLYNLL